MSGMLSVTIIKLCLTLLPYLLTLHTHAKDISGAHTHINKQHLGFYFTASSKQMLDFE